MNQLIYQRYNHQEALEAGMPARPLTSAHPNTDLLPGYYCDICYICVEFKMEHTTWNIENKFKPNSDLKLRSLAFRITSSEKKETQTGNNMIIQMCPDR